MSPCAACQNGHHPGRVHTMYTDAWGPEVELYDLRTWPTAPCPCPWCSQEGLW